RELVLALAAAAPPIARGGTMPGAFPLDPFEFACPLTEAPCAVGAGRLAVLQRCGALVGQGYLVAALQTEHVDAVLVALVAAGYGCGGDHRLLALVSADLRWLGGVAFQLPEAKAVATGVTHLHRVIGVGLAAAVAPSDFRLSDGTSRSQAGGEGE